MCFSAGILFCFMDGSVLPGARIDTTTTSGDRVAYFSYVTRVGHIEQRLHDSRLFKFLLNELGLFVVRQELW